MNKEVVVITGGSGGIGWHLSKGFLEAGYSVVAIDKQLNNELPNAVHFIQADLSDETMLLNAFDTIAREFGTVHVLINNGAVSNFRKSFMDMTVDEWDNVINVNLRGAFICSQAFARLNQGQRYGRIINIASTRWHQNESKHDAYGASKGGLVSLTNSLCVSLSETPITVNAVSPGWIQTSGYEMLTREDHEQHPSGRVGKPEDIVRACLFLASEHNDFINGANLIVDGGMTKRMIYL